MTPRYSTTSEAILREHASAGMSLKAMAKTLNVSPHSLKACLRVLGIKTRGREQPWSVTRAVAPANNPFGLVA